MQDAAALSDALREMSGTTAVLRACSELLARINLDDGEVAEVAATIAARVDALDRSLATVLGQLDTSAY